MMKCQRDKFYLQRKISYLNCAYMSPLSRKVENAGKKGLQGKRHPYRVQPDDFFRDNETLRSLFAKLIGCEEPDRIAMIPSVSYAMATIAGNLPKKKGKIVLAGDQFPSNVYPWNMKGYDLHFVSKPVDGLWTEAIRDAIDDTTSLVTLGVVHWTDGTRFDLKAIGEKAKSVDAAFVLDGTQAIGALPFNIENTGADALVCAGYKWLMGPYAYGLAYYGPIFGNGLPIEQNWINRKNAEDFAGLVNYRDEYEPGSRRFDVGERSNFIAVPMMIAALKQILKWNPESISDYCGSLFEAFLPPIEEMGFKLSSPPVERSKHLFGLQIPEQIALSKLMQDFKQSKVYVSVRGNVIRVSPNVYNDKKDINRFIRVLSDAI
ncbi:MAG: aminotransferase class V-fold PLP-dependent enzyme [Cyclobacteriaceae bacterium]